MISISSYFLFLRFQLHQILVLVLCFFHKVDSSYKLGYGYFQKHQGGGQAGRRRFGRRRRIKMKRSYGWFAGETKFVGYLPEKKRVEGEG